MIGKSKKGVLDHALQEWQLNLKGVFTIFKHGLEAKVEILCQVCL